MSKIPEWISITAMLSQNGSHPDAEEPSSFKILTLMRMPRNKTKTRKKKIIDINRPKREKKEKRKRIKRKSKDQEI